MTFDEALVELGIDAGAGPAEARRAYLRLLKTRRPEEDAAAFMRLREAYELVKPWLEVRAARAANVGRKETPAPLREETKPEAPRVTARPEEPVPNGEDAAEDGGAEDDDDDEKPSVVRFHALLHDGEHVDAAWELVDLYDAAVADASAPLPPVHLALELVLTLHARGERGPARALTKRIKAWLTASGREARALRGPAAVLWAVALELSTLPKGFSAEARSAIARAALAGDLAKARPALAALHDDSPDEAQDAALALRAYAPTLAAALGDALEPARVASPAARSSGFGGLWALFAIVLPMLGRLLSATTTPSSSAPAPRPRVEYPAPRPAATAAPAPDDSRIASLKQAALQEAEAARAQVRARAARAGTEERKRLARAGKELDDLKDAVDREDCVAARAFARDLIPDGGPAAGDLGRAAMRKAAIAFCDAREGRDRPAETP